MQEEATEILKEIKEILIKQNEQKSEPKMLRIKDVAKILGVNADKAGKLWALPDFPRYRLGA